ncbi:MAG: hypothetical protein AAF616_00845 [Bacteroidota bacterium]
MNKLKLISYLCIGCMLASCQDLENCGADDNLNFLIMAFFDKDSAEPKSAPFRFTIEGSTTRYLFAADTTITPADTTFNPPDTVINNGDTTIVRTIESITPADTSIVSDSTFILLPLDPARNSIKYLLQNDTSDFFIELAYDPQVSIFDPECPASLVYTNIDTIAYNVDAVSIPGPITNRLVGTNVQVFF